MPHRGSIPPACDTNSLVLGIYVGGAVYTSAMSARGDTTKPVRVRGLLLEPPDGGGPREVYVNNDDDWAVFYRHPKVKVACLEPDCRGLLTAKQMSKSGLRFFARQSGSCSHFLTDLPIEPDEIEMAPSAPGTGGGPEGAEHLWVKGRLYTIAKKCLDEDPIVEESMTHGDVLLAKSGLVLEYQRWATDFEGRSRDRLKAGARDTIWLVPERLHEKRAFWSAVEHGAMYLKVVDREKPSTSLTPWEHHEQNKNAVLHVSGSIVSFDSKNRCLMRQPRPLDVVLREIIAGERVLAQQVSVYTKSKNCSWPIDAWVLKSDLARWHDEEQRRRSALAEINIRKAPPATGSTKAPAPEPAAPSREAPVAVEQPQATELVRPEPQEHDNPLLTPTTSGEKVNPWLIAGRATPPEAAKPVALIPAPVVPESPEPRELEESVHRTVWDRIVAWFQRL